MQVSLGESYGFAKRSLPRFGIPLEISCPSCFATAFQRKFLGKKVTPVANLLIFHQERFFHERFAKQKLLFCKTRGVRKLRILVKKQ